MLFRQLTQLFISNTWAGKAVGLVDGWLQSKNNGRVIPQTTWRRTCHPLRCWSGAGSFSPPSGSSCCRHFCLPSACSWWSSFDSDVRPTFYTFFFFFFTLITLVLFRVLIFRCFCNTNPSYFLSIFLKGYCSLICCELRLRMLVMTFSSPITHLLASSLLLAIRSRFLRLPLKMMEKQWSSTVPSVYFCRPSDWRPWRTDSMSLMETVEKTTEL